MGAIRTQEIFVARHIFRKVQPPPVRTTLVDYRMSPTQTFEANDGSIDIVFVSWDDGDNSHWLGEFSAGNSQTADWAHYTASHDLISESTIWQVIWGHLEGDSAGEAPRYISHDTEPCDPCSHRIVKATDRYPDVWYGLRSPRPQPVRWIGDYRGFYGCSVAWCGGAVFASLLLALT
jgi:hypothetical protein